MEKRGKRGKEDNYNDDYDCDENGKGEREKYEQMWYNEVKVKIE